jgi:hypothetical protein
MASGYFALIALCCFIKGVSAFAMKPHPNPSPKERDVKGIF